MGWTRSKPVRHVPRWRPKFTQDPCQKVMKPSFQKQKYPLILPACPLPSKEVSNTQKSLAWFLEQATVGHWQHFKVPMKDSSLKDRTKTKPALPLCGLLGRALGPVNELFCNYISPICIWFPSVAEVSALLHWGQMVITPGSRAVSDTW